MDSLAKGDLTATPGLSLNDELGQLSDSVEELGEALQHVDVLRKEVIANVSHDLRTPLATLQGYIETLLMKQQDMTVEMRRHYLEIAIRHCERLSKLVSELLLLAKLDSQAIQLHREPINLGELVQDVFQEFQLKAREKQIRMETNAYEELPLADADIGLIERVLENLIENAIHYTEPGGSIRLDLAPDGEDISVQLRDTGRGIPEKELPHVFNRFYQLGKSRNGESEHSGLGLAIAKRILELHGRAIGVTSTPGVGTTFTFHLPTFQPA